MINVAKLFVLITLSLTPMITASAETPAATPSSAALPSADQVLKHYYAAIGGRAAWEKLHSRVSKGTIEIPAMNNLTGTIEVHMKAPDSILLVINVGGAVIQQGFD